MSLRWVLPALLGLPAGCGPETAPTPQGTGSREELLDPDTCRGCHPTHYQEWAGSMHAYASTDPVFLAMNRRGQEETNGELGSFCVGCHAPMAVREGATTDGLNLELLPRELQGITCYFCHNVDGVEGTHNNPLSLANDTTMRGGILSPRPNSVHRSEYSARLSSLRDESADLCGACHDIVLPSPPAPAPVHLERTFQEWQGSLFAPAQAVSEDAALSCNACHMRVSSGQPIAVGSVDRTHHSHRFPGVDLALTPFPDTGDASLDAEIAADQEREVQDFLDSTLRIEICVHTRFTGDATIEVLLDNAGAGHHVPSGAAQDRRLWVEIEAFLDGEPIYQSGLVPDDQAAASWEDEDLWLIRDRVFDAEGNEVHMFWDAASYTASTIGVPDTLDPLSPGAVLGHALRQFPRAGAIPTAPDRVTSRVRLRPVGLDVIDDLIQSGHLDESIRARMRAHDLLPNRHLGEDPAAPPELAALGAVSHEWSEATRTAGNFSRSSMPTSMGTRECIGMPRRR